MAKRNVGLTETKSAKWIKGKRSLKRGQDLFDQYRIKEKVNGDSYVYSKVSKDVY